MRILIADDHAVVRQGLKTILAEEFAAAHFGEAENAADVLRCVREEDWDILLLDITMPGRDGIDVLKQLRSQRPALPVLILSMHPEDQYAVRALRAGAAGYLTKESAPDELVDALRKVLAGGKHVSESLAERLAVRLEAGYEDALHESLSDREYEVMCMMASGKTANKIAEEMHLAVSTVSTYRARVLDKMRMKTNAELMHYAMEKGLVS